MSVYAYPQPTKTVEEDYWVENGTSLSAHDVYTVSFILSLCLVDGITIPTACRLAITAMLFSQATTSFLAFEGKGSTMTGYSLSQIITTRKITPGPTTTIITFLKILYIDTPRILLGYTCSFMVPTMVMIFTYHNNA